MGIVDPEEMVRMVRLLKEKGPAELRADLQNVKWGIRQNYMLTAADRQNLGLEVIAEGVETKGQLEYMRERGCDIAQGYLYSRPESTETLTPWLKANQRVSETNVRSMPIKKQGSETGS